MNNKMGGDLGKIQEAERYLVEVWKAIIEIRNRQMEDSSLLRSPGISLSFAPPLETA